MFSHNGQLLASGSEDNTIKLWDSTTGTLQRTLSGHSDSIYSVAFSPDGQLLASGSGDNTIRLWDPSTGTLQQTLEGHSNWIAALAFSRDGRLLASGSNDCTIRLWNHAIGTLQQLLNVTGLVTTISFVEDDSYLVTNLGCLEIRPRYDSHISELPGADDEISLLDSQWVTLHGEKVLWLPPEYRPSSWTIRGNTLVLGHPSGQISFMEAFA